MLGTISNQMMSNLQNLQDQLIRMYEKLTQQLQRVVQDHESFKQEINAKILALGNSSSMHLPSTPSSVANISTSVIPPIVTSGTLLPNSSLISTLFPNLTFRHKWWWCWTILFPSYLLLWLRTRARSQNLNGQNFRVSQRNLAPGILQLWLRYHSHLGLNCMIMWHTVVSSTQNTILNGKLYAKLLV